MRTEEIIEQAIKLKPAERFDVVEQILHSLDRPNPEVDRIWQVEAEKRLAAYRAGCFHADFLCRLPTGAILSFEYMGAELSSGRRGGIDALLQ